MGLAGVVRSNGTIAGAVWYRGSYRVNKAVKIITIAVIVVAVVAIMILIFLLRVVVLSISCLMCGVLSITVFSITGSSVVDLLNKASSLSLDVLSA